MEKGNFQPHSGVNERIYKVVWLQMLYISYKGHR